MAQVIYQIIDSYSLKIEKFTKLQIIWSKKTHRLIAVHSSKDLLGWGLDCLVTLGICAVLPKLAQVVYVFKKYMELGHYPDQDLFATPMQMLSVAGSIMGCGGAICLSCFALVCQNEVVSTVNSLFDMEELLLNWGNVMSPRDRGKLTKRETLLVKVFSYVPLFWAYLAPTMGIFGVIEGLDPLTFVVEHFIRPDWKRYSSFWYFTFKAFSVVMVMAATLSSGRIFLAVGCIFVCPSWLLRHDVRLLGKDYEKMGTSGKPHFRLVGFIEFDYLNVSFKLFHIHTSLHSLMYPR